MRVLVTGGAGFIGSAVCRHMVGDHDILNLDKLTYAASLASLGAVELRNDYRFVQGDICDRSLLDRLLAQFQPQAVVHLAAESHVDRSISGSDAFIETNIRGTHTLLEATRNYLEAISAEERRSFRLLHVSTDEVYGSLGPDGLFGETTAYDPRSPYSASKAAADHLVSAWGHTYGLPVLVSKCSNNYGPFQFPEKLIPVIIINALEGRELPVYGDGQHIRDWLHVDDHVRALRAILERGQPGQTYNVGGRNEHTNLAIVETVCELLDELAPDAAIGPRKGLISFVTDRPGHDRRYAIDPLKIETELGWRPKHDFNSGLLDTVKWYLQNRDWWGPLTEKLRAATNRKTTD